MNDYTAAQLCTDIRRYIKISKEIEGDDVQACIVLRYIIERIERLIGEAQ